MAINSIPEKIDPSAYVKDAGRRYANQSQPSGATVNRKDTVSISSNSKELQLVRQAVGSDPQTDPANTAERAQKVEALKNAYSNGQYSVNAKSVADKLIGAHISELA